MASIRINIILIKSQKNENAPKFFLHSLDVKLYVLVYDYLYSVK